MCSIVFFWSRPLGCDHHGFPDAPFEHQASSAGLFKKHLSGVRLLSQPQAVTDHPSFMYYFDNQGIHTFPSPLLPVKWRHSLPSRPPVHFTVLPQFISSGPRHSTRLHCHWSPPQPPVLCTSPKSVLTVWRVSSLIPCEHFRISSALFLSVANFLLSSSPSG